MHPQPNPQSQNEIQEILVLLPQRVKFSSQTPKHENITLSTAFTNYQLTPNST